LTATTASVDRQRQLLRETDEELQTLRRETRSETPPESAQGEDASVGSWLTRIGPWAETRTSAWTAWADPRRAVSDAEEARTALATEQNTLAATLVSVGIDVDGLDVAALMQAADTILFDHAAMQTKRQDAQKRVGELEAAAVRRKAELDEAITASNVWQTGWSTALASTW